MSAIGSVKSERADDHDSLNEIYRQSVQVIAGRGIAIVEVDGG